MSTIRTCSDPSLWEKATTEQKVGEFLQSYAWGEFQRQAGREPVRLYSSSGSLLQGFIHHLPFGMRYLYCPRASVSNNEVFNEFLDEIKKQNFSFVRLEPLHTLPPTVYRPLPVKNLQPQTTLVLDLKKKSEELLAGMHPKTRYNIHLSERKGVTISEEKNAGVFLSLMQDTSTRDQFRAHSAEYYKKMVTLPTAHQLTAMLDGKAIASNICVGFGDTFTYLHGASSNSSRESMAPYLLQWNGMQMAKRLGYTRYDFWGIAPREEKAEHQTCSHNYCWNSTHPWSGITKFKVGFGGDVVSYPGAVDIIFHPMRYHLYQFLRRVRRMV